MPSRYTKFRRRNGVFYAQDTESGKQTSLRTADEAVADQLLAARNASFEQSQINFALAKAYLDAADPALAMRQWQAVMDELTTHGRPSSQERCRREMLRPVYNRIRHQPLFRTTATDFLAMLADHKYSTNNFLRRLHNLALGLGWLVRPILPPKLWPKPVEKPKRAITAEEHGRIVAAEHNLERRLYYEFLWSTGAAQSDAAAMTAANINWRDRRLIYKRMKLAAGSPPCVLTIGPHLESLLRRLPAEGLLFPHLAGAANNHRAAEFRRRCRLLKLDGVSLHSYRRSWAERAKTAGYPERMAQAALGHNSRAVHEAYAHQAMVVCPSLEEYEERIIPMPSPGGAAAGA